MSPAGLPETPLSDPRDPVPVPGLPRPAVLGALTSLRFPLALHVALYHMVRPFGRWCLFAPLMSSGYSAVSFFFLLSGFILTYSHAAEYERGLGSACRFWLARFARVYPVYLLGVLLAAYVDRGLFAYSIERKALLASVFMVQSWSSRLVQNFYVPAWSLSCEAFFYLVFPFLLMPLRRSSRAASFWWIAAFTVLAMAAPVWGLWHYAAPAMHELPVTRVGYGQVLRIRRLPLLALPEFLAGISLGWFYLQHGISERAARRLTWAGAVLLIVILCCSARLPYLFLHNGLLIPVQCAVILGLTGGHWISRLLAHRWLMLLGEASFSFYLFHLLVHEWLLAHFHLQATVRNALWQVVLVTGLAVVLYRFVERPCRRFLLGFARRSRTGNAVA